MNRRSKKKITKKIKESVIERRIRSEGSNGNYRQSKKCDWYMK